MSYRGLRQVAQLATDLDRSAEFYSVVLGREPIGRFEPPGLLFFDLGNDTRLLLEGGASAATLYLEVDDVHAEIDRLRAAGIAITHEPHVIFSHTNQTLGPAGTDEWQAFVTDPDGTLVGLVGYTPTA